MGTKPGNGLGLSRSVCQNIDNPCWRCSQSWGPHLLTANIGEHIERSIQAASYEPTNLDHVVFGIAASAKRWRPQRKYYVDLWWQPGITRGFVWLDRSTKEPLSPTSPPYRISEDTSGFNYSHPEGSRSAIRIARIVSETFRLGLPNVRWFVMGDDDTFFFTENLLQVLSKYDHNQYYYIGSNSESSQQNMDHSYAMAFGGGGFAIKLGVPLTKEPGFHQMDLQKDIFGILTAHPIAPLVSLHHLDNVAPIFPNMTQAAALRHMMEAVRIDPSSVVQQSICYDNSRNWTISVSWGYAIQVYDTVELPHLLEYPLQTFSTWRDNGRFPFMFNTRRVPTDPCEQPNVFFVERVTNSHNNIVSSSYTRQEYEAISNTKCKQDKEYSANAFKKITVTSH
eukprot:Gb_39624 [translate_table: standard]